ncbi:hypothetical protein PRIPAC_73689 [Pristionchus pacificus]|uniref:Uncharacterized protein n=1 Tax=Pristionchus pacificus TaxID=54126 RepID=A0A2A6D083_PRIPA|nr:hypothetical protein PRIPAC_73689 [Pristionchus pacificus]|eukprot:PDM83691.1 hypothetical protein PRIPAC_30178 [Pristionchus pacificus]
MLTLPRVAPLNDHRFHPEMSVLFLLSLIPLVKSQSICIQFVEKCGETVLEVEKPLILHRTRAFSQCVDASICSEERRVFDQCFLESFRAKSSNTASNQFTQTFADYRQGLSNCLEMSALSASATGATNEAVENEIAAMTRLLYESEMIDQFWMLKDGDELRSIQVMDVCKRSTFGRLFGAGINRLMRNSDPTLNNLASSCFLEDSQISCYHSLLRYNLQYAQLLERRDSMLTQCLNSIPITCVTSLSSSCLCAARLSFERRISLDILRCVSDSLTAIEYTAKVIENVHKLRRFGRPDTIGIANTSVQLTTTEPPVKIKVTSTIRNSSDNIIWGTIRDQASTVISPNMTAIEVSDVPKPARELTWKPSSRPLESLLPLNRPLN